MSEALFEHYGVSRRGVLHVGGHLGEELEAYQACGFERITFLEPNPEVYPHLVERVSGAAETFCLAAGESDGQATFHLTADPGQGSLLEPLGQATRQVTVPMRRLDGWAERAYSLLVLDVQGAELQVLRGAAELLGSLDMVVVEVSLRPRYRGGAHALEVEEFLESRDYRAVVRRLSPWGEGGDFAYIRSRPRAKTSGNPARRG